MKAVRGKLISLANSHTWGFMFVSNKIRSLVHATLGFKLNGIVEIN